LIDGLLVANTQRQIFHAYSGIVRTRTSLIISKNYTEIKESLLNATEKV
jgi:hypothetical protein